MTQGVVSVCTAEPSISVSLVARDCRAQSEVCTRKGVCSAESSATMMSATSDAGWALPANWEVTRVR